MGLRIGKVRNYVKKVFIFFGISSVASAINSNFKSFAILQIEKERYPSFCQTTKLSRFEAHFGHKSWKSEKITQESEEF